MKKIIILILIVLAAGIWFTKGPKIAGVETLVNNLMKEKDFASATGYKIFETAKNSTGAQTAVLFGLGGGESAFAVAVFEGEAIKKSFVLQEEGAGNKLKNLSWKSENQISFDQVVSQVTTNKVLTVK